MNKTLEYLERVKARYGAGSKPASDYRAAKLLELTPGAVSAWRTQKSGMSIKTAKLVAELLGENEVVVIAETQLEFCKDPAASQLYAWCLRCTKLAEAPALSDVEPHKVA